MKWINECCCFSKYKKLAKDFSRLSDWQCNMQKGQTSVDMTKEYFCPSRVLQPSRIGAQYVELCGRQVIFNNSLRGFQMNSDTGSYRGLEQIASDIVRRFSQYVQYGPSLTRDWAVKLWDDERRVKKHRHVRKKRVTQYGRNPETWSAKQLSYQLPSKRVMTNGPFVGERFDNAESSFINQTPLSESADSLLKPKSPDEDKISPLLGRTNLLVTRDIEWANLVLGFEQENRYAIVDPAFPQAPVGFIREQSNVIFRQLLRTRRPFIAYVIDAVGNELFRVRRPIWFINSTIYAEVNGKEIGVVHRRWHLWRRIYDLYLGNKQFAVVENPGFWNWTFTLKDSDGNVLAEIDRDWRGIGLELFTDAGQYVIRFGKLESRFTSGSSGEIPELNTSRPLTLSERAVALALAISLDNDYFSRHGGWGLPIIAVGE
ncbi:altered inheritance rate of mitochondria protein 25 [Aristolochia californica]|uniref:altered inheritance rate of mitochondria protein 25 n=1 Tax=Aristolochia californica TaxID=171875 RepID=UPI0035D69659